jgi:hypothetical protein
MHGNKLEVKAELQLYVIPVHQLMTQKCSCRFWKFDMQEKSSNFIYKYD